VGTVEQMKFAVRQTFVEIFGVDGRHHHISAAGNDLHGRLYLRPEISEHYKVHTVSLHVRDRLRESIAFV
jgi:hypothetical protein